MAEVAKPAQIEFEIPPGWKPEVHGFRKRRGKARAVPSQFIFVANSVPYGETPSTERLRTVFEQFGEVIGVYLIDEKPFANVWFRNQPDAVDAFTNLHKTNVVDLDGRQLNLEYTEPRPPSGNTDIVPDFLKETADTPLPEGLYLIEDFISEEEEIMLMERLSEGEWWTSLSRRVQHFGYVFDYNIRGCDPNAPIGKFPSWLTDVINVSDSTPRNLPSDLLPFIESFDQATVNEYECGQGIRRHTDNPEAFHDGIASLSLNSPVVMCFQHADKDLRKCVLIPRRSLLLMTGPSRYDWTHCIRHRTVDCINGEVVKRELRISITFRHINQEFHVNHDNSKFLPTATEMEHVHKVYEAIAPHFSNTRHSPWPQVQKFIEDRSFVGCMIADLGCGNGKYLKLLPSTVVGSGMDRSSNLIKICGRRGLEAQVGDALLVPYRDNYADIVISIAVLHHFSSIEHRIRAIEECFRVLAPGGYGLICAWAKEQNQESRHQFDDGDVLVPWNLKKQYTHNLSSELKSIADDNAKHLTFQRYCHVYQEGELEGLIKQVGQENIEIVRVFFNEGNWCVEFKKLEL